MTKMRCNWTVLLIGGASGTGKSSIAYGLAKLYGVNVIELDDISQAVKAVTTGETLPALHGCDTEADWRDMTAEENVKWLIRVSRELAPALRAVAEGHLESGIPIILEGDFIEPSFVASFRDPKVRGLFVTEPDTGQIVRNYLAREGGEEQIFRAEISALYGGRLADACQRLGIPTLESRPWDTAVVRAGRALES